MSPDESPRRTSLVYLSKDIEAPFFFSAAGPSEPDDPWTGGVIFARDGLLDGPSLARWGPQPRRGAERRGL